ncbi:hypothetical protein DB346_14195 [Verrucomicrobia bacterium LW23]|nr:hypothetical protein DB346_14195 [Verrucomicrobia bacterium LW23]
MATTFSLDDGPVRELLAEAARAAADMARALAAVGAAAGNASPGAGGGGGGPDFASASTQGEGAVRSISPADTGEASRDSRRASPSAAAGGAGASSSAGAAASAGRAAGLLSQSREASGRSDQELAETMAAVEDFARTAVTRLAENAEALRSLREELRRATQALANRRE